MRLQSRLLIVDIKTGIETFAIWILLSRLELRLLNLESWYRDWNRDFWDQGLDIETGIETQKTGEDPCDRDSCESHCSSLVMTTVTFYSNQKNPKKKIAKTIKKKSKKLNNLYKSEKKEKKLTKIF